MAEVAGRAVEDRPLAALWLGTNKANRRAQRSYSRQGFVVAGTRRFRVGESLEEDVVMVRDLRPATGPDAHAGGGRGGDHTVALSPGVRPAARAVAD